MLEVRVILRCTFCTRSSFPVVTKLGSIEFNYIGGSGSVNKRLLVALVLEVLLGSSAYAADVSEVDVIVNGKKVGLPTKILSGRTMVPVREMVHALGGSVQWNATTRAVTIRDDINEIVLKIGSSEARVNSKEDTVDVVPFILNDRAMVPLRFVANNLSMGVEWIDELNSVTITRNDYFSTLPKDITMGFTVSYYDNDNLSYTSVQNNKNINMIAVFNYSFDANDNIKTVDMPQQNTVVYANDNGIIPLAVVHNIYNGSFDKELLHNMLSNKDKRETLIRNILVEIVRNGYGGVNVDFENIGREDKDLFTMFVQELKDVLSRHGYITTVCVPAKTGDKYVSSWNYAFDYEKIGKAADYIIIMAYDEHYMSSKPGAIASVNWVKDVLDYATLIVDPNKIILGLALYGYDWSNAKGTAVPAKNCERLAYENNAKIEWDKQTMSPHFAYTKNSVYHEVWYENNDSLRVKIDLARKYKLAGTGYWRLGLEINGLLPK